MDVVTAMREARCGRTVRRASRPSTEFSVIGEWGEEDIHATVVDGYFRTVVGVVRLPFDDIIADDWEVVP